MAEDRPSFPEKPHEQAFSVQEGDRVVLRRYKTVEAPTLAFADTGVPFHERRFLMRSEGGHYFLYNEFTTSPSIEPLTLQAAVAAYIEMTPVQDFKRAFPDVVEENA